MKFEISEIATDSGYPVGEFPDTTSHLLFDIGYSYSMLRKAEMMFQGLRMALADHETAGSEANQELASRLDEMLAQMKSFRERRLNARDEVYNAGYLAAAELDAAKQSEG